MLRHFRINDPYRLLSLLLLLILASLPFFITLPGVTLQELKGMVVGEVIGNKTMYVEVIDSTPPMMALTDGALNFLFGRALLPRHILALIIIFFQAAYFGILLINNKAYNEGNYLPSLIFGFLCFFSFDLLATTPELLASCLLLLCLDNLFKEIEFRMDRDAVVLNLGVFLGMASLFVLSYTIFLPGAIIILIIFARVSLRKILLLLFGYALVHAILITIYYCYERTDELWTHFYAANITQAGINLVGMRAIWMLGLVPLVYFVFSLFMLTREARFTRYQSQLLQVMFLWLGVALVQVWLTPEFTPHSFLTCIPPLAYFISHYLLLINRKWIAEILLWIFMAGMVSVCVLSRNNKLERVDYAGLFPAGNEANPISGKKVMVLGDNPSIYQQNKLGGFFLNWELSRKYFEHPDYFQNINKINEAFTQNPPEVIIDEKGLMPEILRRIPRLENQYRRENAIYYLY